jgi:uncharacterized protein (TIGR02145 family)
VNDTAWRLLSTPGYCYYANNIDATEREKWGLLYNWAAIATGKLAPSGWHVPSDSDWSVLENFLITNGFNYDGTTNTNRIAKALAVKEDWQAMPNAGAIGNDLGSNNRSGFSAFPSGFRDAKGVFLYRWNSCLWWSATESGASQAWDRSLNNSFSSLFRSADNKKVGESVRLVKD